MRRLLHLLARPTTRRVRRVFTAELVAILCIPAGLFAQGFDSPLVPGGRFRIQALPSLHAFDTRFGLRSEMGNAVEGEEPLGFDFTREGIGPDLFPELQDDEELLAAAAENPDYRLRLGSMRVFMDAYSTRIPVRVDAGISDWLTVGVMVPFEHRRVDSELRVATGGANVGESPLITDPGAPSAFLNAYRAGLQASTLAVDDLCAQGGEGSQPCVEGREFVTAANRTFERLEDAYSGSEFFFLESSSEGDALSQRIQEIQATMESLGVSSFTDAPPLASEPLAGPDEAGSGFASRFIEPIYGDVGLPLDGGESLWEVGDLEFSAHVRLLEVVSRDTTSDGRPAFRTQLAAGALYRLGVATRDTLRDFLDLDAQRGTNDVEIHVMADLDWPAARVGARLQILHGVQGSRELRRRVASPEAVLQIGAPTGIVSWSPGDYTALNFHPRVFLTPELALGGSYRYYERGEAQISLVGLDGDVDPSDVDVSVLEDETRATLHHVGARMIFSTLGGHRARERSPPFELEAGWEKAVAGSGGRTPQGSSFYAGLRLYFDLWAGL